MHYTGHTLIRHLNVLEHLFLQRCSDDDAKRRSTFFDLEMLPYSLGAAWHALALFAGIQNDIVASVPVSQLEGRTIVGLSPQQRDLMSYMLDAFFDAARRSQNAVIHYLSRGLRLSLPSSMNDLIKGLRRDKYSLPDQVTDYLLRYWEEHGSRLKAYRDLGQHHALITSDARVFMIDGRVAVYLLLPSNPEVKNASALTFGNPRVHAYPYAAAEFRELLILLHWLTRGLVPVGGFGRMDIRFFRESVTAGPREGHAPEKGDAVDDWVLEMAKDLDDAWQEHEKDD